MKKSRTRHLWRSKILVNACLLVVIPLLAVGGGFSLLYFENVQRNLMMQNEDYLSMTKARLEQALANVETQTVQWMKLNIGTMSSIENSTFTRDYLELMRYVNSLEVLKNSNNWMERVVFCHGASGTLLDSEYGIVLLKDYRYREIFDALDTANAQTGWYRITGADAHESVLFVNRLPRNTSGAQDTLIAVLSQAKLNVEINPLPKVIPSASFVLIDQRGKILFPTGEDEAVLLPPDVHRLHVGSSTSFYWLDGTEMVTTYAVGESGWKVLATGPRGVVFAGAAWVWQMVVSIMGVGLFLSVLSILLFSQWMYKPFQGLMKTFTRIAPERIHAQRTAEQPQVLDEVAYFQDTIANVHQEKTAYMDRWQSVQQVIVQQYLLLLLRNGRYAAMETIPDTLPKNSAVIVSVMHLEAHSNRDSLLSQDRPLAFTAIENIAQELLSEYPHLRGYLLAQYPTCFILVCFPTRTLPEIEINNDMRAYWLHVQEALLHYLNIHVSIGVGRLYENQLDASLSHNEALMAMRYHLLGMQELDACFYREAIGDAQSVSLRYPTALEMRIVAHLKENKLDAAQLDLLEFGQQVQHSGSYLFCRQAYQLLLATIVQTLIRDDRWAELVLEDHLFEALGECVTLLEMQNWMRDRVFPLFSHLQQQQDNGDGAQRIVEGVLRYVEEHITGDLSLLQCADAVGISASYLSRIFKRCCGVAFLEYVTGKKIDYVKERLRTTQESIGELAAQVGYSERNLYRTFIKLEGLSPGNYREKNQQAE